MRSYSAGRFHERRDSVVDKHDISHRQVIPNLNLNGERPILASTLLRRIEHFAVGIGRWPHRADCREDEPRRMTGLLAIRRDLLQSIRDRAAINIKLNGKSIDRPQPFRHCHGSRL